MDGILLIHGFCGTRNEIKPLYDFLKSNNLVMSMPLLTGHEKDNKILSKAKYTDWVSDVENAYIELSKKCDNITVIGFSMGGLLGCRLYKKYKFQKLITINTPIYYWDIKRILINLLNCPRVYYKKYFTASTNKPLKSLFEFLKLLESTKKEFNKINCPALIIQAEDDDTVNIKSGDYIYKNITGEKYIFKPETGGHIIFKSNSYNIILDKINTFIFEREKP